MDFKLFGGVVKRYKRVVISGTVLAIALSVLSYGMPGLKGGKPTIIPRGSEVWQGNAEILISEAGFPYGRATSQVIPGSGTSLPPRVFGDESYLSSLSSVYAAMANGNALQQQVARETHFAVCPAKVTCGNVLAAEVPDPNTSAPLPLITVTATAPTAIEAAKLATTTVSVLQREVTKQQIAAGTPVDQRVELQTLKSGSPATLSKGYSKSVPILVLFAVLSASIALAFILNNHSNDPVRSTRRRPDEGLVPDRARALADAGNGRIARPQHHRVHTGSGRFQLLGLGKADSPSQPADEQNAAAQRVAADEPSAAERRRVWSAATDRLRGPALESELRD